MGDGAKRLKETWLDWMPAVSRSVAMESAQPLISKEGLLSKLAEAGVKATDSDLVYWQKRGIIPYPTKRRGSNATYSTYPAWMVGLIQTVRQLQDDGETLTEIAETLRGLVAQGAGIDADSLHDRRMERAHRELTRHSETVIQSLNAHAAHYSDMTGDRITSVEVVFHHAAPTVGTR